MAMLAIGIDLGGTNTKGALVNAHGKVTHKKVVSSSEWRTASAVVDGLAGLIEELRGCASAERVKGIGLGMPGPLNVPRGLVLTTPNLPFKKPFPIKAALEKLLKEPVYLQNDANCAALGETVWGAGRGKSVVVMITLGTGVGGGIVLSGKIFDGLNGQGGELGHVPVGEVRSRCNAGHPSCLEGLIAKERIKDMAKEMMGERMSPIEVERLAREGNKKAAAVYERVGHFLGIALSSFANIFNPDAIIVGGGVSPAFDLMRGGILDEMQLRVFPSILKNIKLTKAQLGNEAGFLGAAQLVFEAHREKKR